MGWFLLLLVRFWLERKYMVGKDRCVVVGREKELRFLDLKF